jgi:hypothetical protein
LLFTNGQEAENTGRKAIMKRIRTKAELRALPDDSLLCFLNQSGFVGFNYWLAKGDFYFPKKFCLPVMFPSDRRQTETNSEELDLDWLIANFFVYHIDDSEYDSFVMVFVETVLGMSGVTPIFEQLDLGKIQTQMALYGQFSLAVEIVPPDPPGNIYYETVPDPNSRYGERKALFYSESATEIDPKTKKPKLILIPEPPEPYSRVESVKKFDDLPLGQPIVVNDRDGLVCLGFKSEQTVKNLVEQISRWAIYRDGDELVFPFMRKSTDGTKQGIGRRPIAGLFTPEDNFRDPESLDIFSLNSDQGFADFFTGFWHHALACLDHSLFTCSWPHGLVEMRRTMEDIFHRQDLREEEARVRHEQENRQ